MKSVNKLSFVTAVLMLMPLMAQALPFVPTTDPASTSTQWYHLKTLNQFVYTTQSGYQLLELDTSAGLSNDYLWCFVGTEATGYKLYNLGQQGYLQEGMKFGDGTGSSTDYCETGSGNEFYIYDYQSNQKLYLNYSSVNGFYGSNNKGNSFTVMETVIEPPMVLPYKSLIPYDFHIPHNTLSNTGSDGFANLIDGDKSTQWRVVNNSGAWETIWLDFMSNVPFTPTAYVMTTSGDTHSYPNRNPKTWKIYAKADVNDEWDVIANVTNGAGLGTNNICDYRFPIDGVTKEFRYFRFEVSGINGKENSNYTFKLAELQFTGKTATPSVTGDVTGDGVVDVDDLNTLINMMLGLAPQGTSGDVTGDGVVDIDDVNAVINIMLGLSPSGDENTFTVGGVSFKMVPVKGGTFTMGATPEQEGEAQQNEYPAHQVTLSDYLIGETEVTQALWQAVMGSNPSYYNTNLNNPVERICFDDCKTFISKLNEMTGKNFRLPTEAEWEYAARGGNKSKGYKFAGDNNLGLVGWYYDNSGSKTHPVGSLLPNELGLYDMSGNVGEYCEDDISSYSDEAQTNPLYVYDSFLKVYRGGSSFHTATTCRVTFRAGRVHDGTSTMIGLRLAMSK